MSPVDTLVHAAPGLVARARRALPEPLKPPLRALVRGGHRTAASVGCRMRACAYRDPDSHWLRAVPAALRRRWRLDNPPPGARRVELGSGVRPRPGYVHVDVNRLLPDLDLLARGHRLPLPDGWAQELLSIHMVEHLPPQTLEVSLCEWRRVLRAGGVLEVHTPNGAVIGRALAGELRAADRIFWALQSGLFGYGPHPRECVDGRALGERGDHRLVFTFGALKDLLERVGFADVRDLSAGDLCFHASAWKDHLPGMCLAVRATRA